jgi:hypothetical protein
MSRRTENITSFISLGVDTNLITYPFKRNAPWTTHQRRKKKIRIGNFSLDGRNHQTGDAAFTPATSHDLHHLRANNQPEMLRRAHHTKPDPKSMRVMLV